MLMQTVDIVVLLLHCCRLKVSKLIRSSCSSVLAAGSRWLVPWFVEWPEFGSLPIDPFCLPMSPNPLPALSGMGTITFTTMERQQISKTWSC